MACNTKLHPSGIGICLQEQTAVTGKPATMSHSLSKAELIEAGDKIIGGNVKDLAVKQIRRLMTVTQFVTDRCLNEIERRGELTFAPSPTGLAPIVPYESDYMVETILTREDPVLDQREGEKLA
jgi:hypothetical protein